jgi:hypothetical protein
MERPKQAAPRASTAVSPLTAADVVEQVETVMFTIALLLRQLSSQTAQLSSSLQPMLHLLQDPHQLAQMAGSSVVEMPALWLDAVQMDMTAARRVASRHRPVKPAVYRRSFLKPMQPAMRSPLSQW